jgi:hypothetical protein
MSKQAANRALELGDRISTPLPPSGVRAKKLNGESSQLHQILPIDALVMPDTNRHPFDTLDKTDVKAPNPMLLAIARGNLPKRPSRRFWFGLGMVAGMAVMWLAIGDVAPAYRVARTLATEALTSIQR